MLRSLLVVNASLQWMDASTTALLLGRGGREANPVMAYWIEATGVGGFLLLKLVLALAILAFLPFVHRLDPVARRQALLAAFGFAAFMTLVVANNALVAVA